MTDIVHHHLALAVLFIFAGHMYKTNWEVGHDMKVMLEAHKGPFTGMIFYSNIIKVILMFS